MKTGNASISKTLGDYIIKQTIGKGTFSKVKLGINKTTNQKVAIKILEKCKIVEKDDLERIVREMSIITKLNHQNVIKVFEMYETSENFLIIMEYCEGGELFNYIVEHQRLSEEETAYFFYQLINGIEYIHSQKIVHRDLKPENLLLDSNNILKIIDFGLSNYYNGTYLSTPCGSPCYASPEMVGGNTYNGFYIDVWSTGIILFAMMCGYLPFEDPDNEVLFKKILECKLHYPSHLSPLAKDIMKKILVTDPEKRIKIEEIKQHKFYLKGKKLFNLKFKDENNEQPKHDQTNEEDDNDDTNPREIKSDLLYRPIVTEAKKNNVAINNQLFKDYFENSTKNNKVRKMPKINIVNTQQNSLHSPNLNQKLSNKKKINSVTTENEFFDFSKRKQIIRNRKQPVESKKNNFSTLNETPNYLNNLNFLKLTLNKMEKKKQESSLNYYNINTNGSKGRKHNFNFNMNKGGFHIPNMIPPSSKDNTKTTRPSVILATTPNSEKPRLPSIKIIDKNKKNRLNSNGFNINATNINPRFIRLKTESNNNLNNQKRMLRINDFINSKMNSTHHTSNLVNYNNVNTTGNGNFKYKEVL